MGSYKNYLDKPKSETYERFNKTILQVWIKIEYNFAIYQNL